jgi:histidinol-phosphatase (PHP family)
MKADYHLHSSFSFDSKAPMEEQIESGIRAGLDEMCFTEHVDYGVMTDWDDPRPPRIREGIPYRNVDYPRYFAALSEMKQRFAGRVTLRQGLELGVQSHTVAQYDALFEKYRAELDFTLLSVHQVDDLEFYPPEYMEGRSQDEYNLGYYEELLRVARDFDHYSVLAHLDVMRRYDPAGEYPFEKTRDIVAEILRAAIQKGKGVELNTASWRYQLEDIQPRREIMRLYRDLGGEILTIGSDAHRPERVAGNFDEARAILRDELGFRYFCTFEHMEPAFHEL